MRHRHYVSPHTLVLLRPALRHSHGRDAYVLRLVGNRFGPVLRRDLRGGHSAFDGLERRRTMAQAGEPGPTPGSRLSA
jgi:hypothetical protein